MKRVVYGAVLVAALLFLVGCTVRITTNGALEGQVLYADNNSPVVGAYVYVGGRFEIADSNGYFRIGNLPADSYYIQVEYPSFVNPIREPVVIQAGKTTYLLGKDALVGVRDTSPTTGELRGYAYIPRPISTQAFGADDVEVVFSMEPLSDRYEPLKGAKVTLDKGPYSTTTGSDGWFRIQGISPDDYIVTVTHDKLRRPAKAEVKIRRGEVTYLTNSKSIYGGIGYYIVVGISEYQYLDDVVDNRNAGPAADAELIYNRFYRSPWAGYIWKMTNSEATKKAILGAIAEAAMAARSSLSKDDYLVFYFSGRSQLDRISPYDERHDWTNTITDLELSEAFAEFPGEVIVLLDGVESGSLADGIPLDPGELRDQMFVPLALGNNTDYTVIASSFPDETANVRNTWPYYSVFSYYVDQGLKGPADGYRGVGEKDGIITDIELYEYLYKKMYDEYFDAPEDKKHTPFIYPEAGRNTPVYQYK